MGKRLGVAAIGTGGAVATTAAVRIETIRSGSKDPGGPPLADRATPGPAGYGDLAFGIWDLGGDDLAPAAPGQGVVTEAGPMDGAPALRGMKPWPGVGRRGVFKAPRTADGSGPTHAFERRRRVFDAWLDG